MLLPFNTQIWFYRQPYYHLEKQFNKRAGFIYPRQSMARSAIDCANPLQPLYNLTKDEVIDYDVGALDATTLQVLNEPGRLGGLREGYEGAQDYDLILRASEIISQQNICHIPCCESVEDYEALLPWNIELEKVGALKVAA